MTAAAVRVTVFSAFLSDQVLVIKSIAFALAFGILFDALLVRMRVIPAVHQLLGDRAWWLPRWLDRLLPNLDIEGKKTSTGPGQPTQVTDDPATQSA